MTVDIPNRRDEVNSRGESQNVTEEESGKSQNVNPQKVEQDEVESGSEGEEVDSQGTKSKVKAKEKDLATKLKLKSDHHEKRNIAKNFHDFWARKDTKEQRERRKRQEADAAKKAEEEGTDSEVETKKKKKKDAPEAEGEEEKDEIERISTAQALKQYNSSLNGLNSGDIPALLEQHGRNSIEEEKHSPILKYLSYFWNPLAGSMEVGAAISLIVGDWLDFGLILALLIGNATIGYWEEAQADSAIAALKGQLALKALVKRDGSDWQEIDAEELVPGDIIHLRSGNVVPADCKMIEEEQQVKIDQSSLTGESLPVTKNVGDAAFSGSTIKQGTAEAMVYATGTNTYFGRSAALVNSAHTEGHYKQLLSAFGWFCIIFIIIFVVFEIITEFGIRKRTCSHYTPAGGYCTPVDNLVVLIVGGVPIAMPTVLSVTMAIGAGKLAKKGAICSRLTAVEDLASMDTLCTDKTGTLTKNELEVGAPVTFGDCTPEQLILDACLASEFQAENLDPIDKALKEYHEEMENAIDLAKYQILEFYPFDPVSKRTYSKVSGDGKEFIVAKGAPQIILDKATNRSEIAKTVNAKIKELAAGGYRALGVGRAEGHGNGENWIMEGIVPLFDPPRDDTRDTIQKAMALGITVKMLTGDQQAIAAETAKMLGMGSRIMTAKSFDGEDDTEFAADVDSHDGFSQVKPEHKFRIVENLQNRNHVVAMTGDGVNDAPALKKANIGFAVAGATEAARSASDIVMTEPGLSVMVDAIRNSRKIFERMKNYSTYAMSVTVRIVLTFSIITFIYDWYFPTLLVLIIAILNDGTILTISRDRVEAAPLPDKWNFRQIFIMAFLLGIFQVISTVGLFIIIKETNFFQDDLNFGSISDDELRAFIYLQVSISGQSTIFVTRTRGWAITKKNRPAYIVLAAFCIAQIIATILGVYGADGYPNDGDADIYGCGWKYAGLAWAWSVLFFFPMDFIKFGAQRYIFRSNIPFIHPYSDEDKKRDLALERKRKMALSGMAAEEIAHECCVEDEDEEDDDGDESAVESSSSVDLRSSSTYTQDLVDLSYGSWQMINTNRGIQKVWVPHIYPQSQVLSSRDTAVRQNLVLVPAPGSPSLNSPDLRSPFSFGQRVSGSTAMRPRRSSTLPQQ